MNTSHHHDDDGDLAMLTYEDRIYIRAEIDDLDALLLTCRDSGVWRELTRVRRHLSDELAAGRRLPIGEDTSTWYDHEIIPLDTDAGAAGWRLRLLQDGVVVGGGVYSVAVDDGSFVPWWTGLSKAQRTQWLMRSATSSPAEAYLIYLLDEAWHDAAETASEWLDSRLQDKSSDA